MSTTQYFRLIGNYQGYEVGDDGSVRSYLCHGSGGYLNDVPHQLRPRYAKKNGKRTYPVVVLYGIDGKEWTIEVHTLVLTAFVGPRPLGMEARHFLDGDATNPSLYNADGDLRLCWGTPEENHQDKVRHGTVPLGMAHPQAKLTEDRVREIRRSTEKGCVLAWRLGVSRATVSMVRNNIIWKHVI